MRHTWNIEIQNFRVSSFLDAHRYVLSWQPCALNTRAPVAKYTRTYRFIVNFHFHSEIFTQAQILTTLDATNQAHHRTHVKPTNEHRARTLVNNEYEQ